MKRKAKSAITLPPKELRLVLELHVKFGASSKVDVVRRGLRLPEEVTDQASLRESYRRASLATRESVAKELDELDHLAAEGLDE